MKMTMHINEDILAQAMDLTGAKTKTATVEMALQDLVRRRQQQKLFREPLWPTEDAWVEDIRPHPSEAIDSPDIDEAAVQRFMDRHRQTPSMVAEDSQAGGGLATEDPRP